MRYFALCCDYDGTIAHHGRLDDATIAALERVRASGRKLILVTGRSLADLERVCPRLDLFDCIVAENGALLHWPGTRKDEVLGEAPPEAFISALEAAGVSPLSRGRVIVATWEPHQGTVLEAIRSHGLEHQVIFNKGAVMVLPTGINKATGLASALDQLSLSPRNAVGVGDAENDHAFLSLCECAVAVANALPALKEQADFVTVSDHGSGVRELIAELLENDLTDRGERLHRHHILLGSTPDGRDIRIPPYGLNLMLVGTSGSGKSTLATGLFERLAEGEYTFCIVDPEGDYHGLEGAVTLGTSDRPPGVEEVIQLLRKPDGSCVVDLVAMALESRPGFALGLIGRLLELRGATGRPHWIVLDEAHHLMPAERSPGASVPPTSLQNALMITVHPRLVAPTMLSGVAVLIVVGQEPGAKVLEFAQALGTPPPELADVPEALESGEAVVWFRDPPGPPVRIRAAPSRQQRRRHARKYAEGELPEDRSFYFRGPEQKLNLRVQNLILFMQIAEGVDEETWMHHLRAGDYSTWIEQAIKDSDLAKVVREVEETEDSPKTSRQRVREAIEERYTLPAKEGSGTE